MIQTWADTLTRKSDEKRVVGELEALGDHNGWHFTYEYPGLFCYSHKGLKLSVFCTPDYHQEGELPIDVQTEDGEVLFGKSVPLPVEGRTGAQLLDLVRPTLDSWSRVHATIERAGMIAELMDEICADCEVDAGLGDLITKAYPFDFSLDEQSNDVVTWRDAMRAAVFKTKPPLDSNPRPATSTPVPSAPSPAAAKESERKDTARRIVDYAKQVADLLVRIDQATNDPVIGDAVAEHYPFEGGSLDMVAKSVTAWATAIQMDADKWPQVRCPACGCEDLDYIKLRETVPAYHLVRGKNEDNEVIVESAFTAVYAPENFGDGKQDYVGLCEKCSHEGAPETFGINMTALEWR